MLHLHKNFEGTYKILTLPQRMVCLVIFTLPQVMVGLVIYTKIMVIYTSKILFSLGKFNWVKVTNILMSRVKNGNLMMFLLSEYININIKF